jgi:DNA invertase Pin-like site-specific DNA recombinase
MIAQKRVAIYARVSTVDKGQDPETQLLALREYAARRGFILVGQYVDYASGRRDDRPQYQALFKAARTRQIDVVLVWRYDRFARSTQALVNALKEFQHLGVDFISYQENIDTTTPQGELIFTVMASLAQFESALISERVKAGMARAKAQGRRISAPRLPRRSRPTLPCCMLRVAPLLKSVSSLALAMVRRGITSNASKPDTLHDDTLAGVPGEEEGEEDGEG